MFSNNENGNGNNNNNPINNSINCDQPFPEIPW